MGDEGSDFFDGLQNDALALASAATRAGSVDIYNDITGANLTPALAVQQQQQKLQQNNSQLLFFLVIGFVIYKYA